MGPNEQKLNELVAAARAGQLDKAADAWTKGADGLRGVAEKLRARQADIEAAYPQGEGGTSAGAAFGQLAAQVEDRASDMDQGAASLVMAKQAIKTTETRHGNLGPEVGTVLPLGPKPTPTQADAHANLLAAQDGRAQQREQNAKQILDDYEQKITAAQGKMGEAAKYQDMGMADTSSPGSTTSSGNSTGATGTKLKGGKTIYSTSTQGTIIGTGITGISLGAPVLGGGSGPRPNTQNPSVMPGEIIQGGTAEPGTAAPGGGGVGGSAIGGGGSGAGLAAGGAAGVLGGGKGLLGKLGGASSARGGSAAAAGRGGASAARGGSASSKPVMGGRSSGGSSGVLGKSSAPGGQAGGARAGGGQAGGARGGSSAARGAAGGRGAASGSQAGAGRGGSSAARGAAGGRGATSGSQAGAGRGGSSAARGAAGGRGAASGSQAGGARGASGAKGAGAGRGGPAPGSQAGGRGGAGRSGRNGDAGQDPTRKAMELQEDWLDDDDVTPGVIR